MELAPVLKGLLGPFQWSSLAEASCCCARALGSRPGARIARRAPNLRSESSASLRARRRALRSRHRRYALFNLDAAPRDSVDPCCAFKDDIDALVAAPAGVGPPRDRALDLLMLDS